MPRRDGTGPEGRGPGTGRGLGSCKSSKTSEIKQVKRVDVGRNIRNNEKSN